MPDRISKLYTPQVVIVENDENDAIILTRVLQRTGVNVVPKWVRNAKEFMAAFEDDQVDLVISDYNLQPETAVDILRMVHDKNPGVPVIVVSHHIGEKAAVEVMKAGARDVVNKVDYKHLVASVSKELIDLDRIREREHLTTKIFDIDRERRSLEKALQQVQKAEQESKSLLAQLNKVFESSPEGIRVVDREFNVLRVNAKYLSFTSSDASESCTGKCFEFTPRDWCKTSHCTLMRALAGEEIVEEQIKLVDESGMERHFVLRASALKGADGEVDGIVESLRDITDWHQMQRQVMQAQKMESIGQLAAGIAHEINTPTQFVGDNIAFLKDGFNDLIGLLAVYDEVVSDSRADKMSDSNWKKLLDAKADADVEYLVEEIPQAIAQSAEGTERISSIVKAMKEFSHPGTEESELYNVNKNIQNTVTVARNEWKYVSRVNLNLGYNLPMVLGYPGEFNQTILNMVVNAAHAIEKKTNDKPGWKGTISIKTYIRGKFVVIEIADNGSGIPAEIIDRVYDPFFTTKGVGKGTGQGLAIAHSSIVDKHNGTIDVSSIEGEGTTFTIALPAAASDETGEHSL